MGIIVLMNVNIREILIVNVYDVEKNFVYFRWLKVLEKASIVLKNVWIKEKIIVDV
jgi:hypothetical protein